jgi:hypothetical protein
MAQQVDINGQPVPAARSTSLSPARFRDPAELVSDFSLSQNPNPLNCDQTGRVPMFWLADGLIHVR